MKLKLFLFLLLPISAFAQSGLLFKTKYFRAEDNWVAFPKKEKDDSYLYGFVYLDEQAGFTLQVGGTFRIDETGKYIPEKKDTPTANIKLRLTPNTADVAIIKDDKLAELGVDKVPNWLKYYKESKDKVAGLVARGYQYNHIGGSDLAIPLLEEAYGIDPDAKGLNFELSFAYNATKDYKSAETILVKAIEKEPKNVLLYKELLYAYVYQDKLSDAENIYKKSTEEVKDNTFKAEMAFNMAQAYYQKRDKENFKIWAKITRKYCPKEYTDILDYLTMFEKKL